MSDDQTILNLLLELNRKQDDQSDKLHDIDLNYAKLNAQFEAHLSQSVTTAQKISDIEKRLEDYNHQLGIHIAGVQELKKITSTTDSKVTDIDSRVTSLEAPRKVLATAKRFMVELGKLAVAAAAIYGFLKLIFPHM